MALHLLDSRRTHIGTVTTVRAWVSDGESVWTILACQDTTTNIALVLSETGEGRRPEPVKVCSGHVISAGWLAAYCKLTAAVPGDGTTIDLEA